jgi:hypothetical protein
MDTVPVGGLDLKGGASSTGRPTTRPVKSEGEKSWRLKRAEGSHPAA